MFTGMNGKFSQRDYARISDEPIVVLNRDIVNANAVANTLLSVPELTLVGKRDSTYWFRFVLHYTAAATTTGSRFTVAQTNPGFQPTNFIVDSTLTATTRSVLTSTALQAPSAASASSLTAGNVAIIEGIGFTVYDSNLFLQFSSEIASSAITLLTGSFLRYRKLR